MLNAIASFFAMFSMACTSGLNLMKALNNVAEAGAMHSEGLTESARYDRAIQKLNSRNKFANELAATKATDIDPKLLKAADDFLANI